VRAYRIEALLDDLAGLIARLAEGEKEAKAHVVGHDWGGALAWVAPLLSPERLLSLTVLNAPHPLAFRRELRTNPAQRKKSSYVFFFQLPWLPERLLSRNGGAAVGRALRGGSHVKSAFSWEETLPYRQAFSDPAAVAAALGYYRAAFRGRPAGAPGPRGQPIAVPTLILWGREDRFLGLETIAPDRLAPYFAPGHAPEVRVVEGAGHFLQNEAPAQVNQALLRFLGPVGQDLPTPPSSPG